MFISMFVGGTVYQNSEKNKGGEGSTGRGFRADEGRKQRKKP